MRQVSAPPGWYPDTQLPGQQRYWDGVVWTEHRAPLASQRPAQPAAPTPSSVSPSEAPQRAKVPLFGARAKARETGEELESLRAEMRRLGVLDVVDLQRERDELQTQISNSAEELRRQRAEGEARRQALSEQLAELSQQVVLTEDAAILQEIGLYDYTHPLSDSTKYKEALAVLQGQIKAMARVDGGAIEATTSWTVNGSQAEGRRMVRDFSKLMLRAYNAEADNLVRGMKPYKLESAKDRLEKVAQTIAKLGKSMQIRVSPGYHRLRIQELELTADFREMLAREKDKEREERERLREERKVQAEIEREREKLKKEQSHYQNALDALVAKGDTEAADRMRAQLADVQKAIEDVDYRAANARAGYVYVISNLGSFGERMIKVGMTRRLEPLDRIKELSDASVPFNFDVHALFFADDAVGIEAKMHQQLADRRVNRVNTRREFFYATPAEARELLMQLTGDLLQFDEAPEALEFHQSLNTTPH